MNLNRNHGDDDAASGKDDAMLPNYIPSVIIFNIRNNYVINMMHRNWLLDRGNTLPEMCGHRATEKVRADITIYHILVRRIAPLFLDLL